MNKNEKSNYYKNKGFNKKRAKLIAFLVISTLMINSIFIYPPQKLLPDFNTKNGDFKIIEQSTPYFHHSMLNSTNHSLNYNYHNKLANQNNSITPWAISNLTFSKSMRYKGQTEFILNQNEQNEKRISFPLTKYEQIKVNTSKLYYSQINLIDNNSIDWRTPISSTSSIIQKNPSSVVLSYYDEGFFPQVVYRYWPSLNLKQDFISYLSNITVRGDPNTDTGDPKVATVYFVVETSLGIFFYYYILYSELPVSANSTYDFRFLINASLGESVHLNFSFPNSLISLGLNETYRLLDIVYSFTPGLSIEFSKPILLYKKMIRPTELDINGLVSNDLSLYYSNSTLLIRPEKAINFTIIFPEKSHGKLAITATWLVDTRINISLLDQIQISFNTCFLNYSSQIPYYYTELNISLPFKAKYSTSLPNNQYIFVKNDFLIIENNNTINNLKNEGTLTLTSQYYSYFLSSIIINHNVNKTLDFRFLEKQGVNIANNSILTIYNNSHVYYLKADPSKEILYSNNIPSLLDHGYVWGAYVIFNENVSSFLYLFQISIITYQTILFLNNVDEKNSLIGYRWLNITIEATYLAKSNLQPVIDTQWFLTIYTRVRNYSITPTIKIFENTTFLIFTIKGWLNPGTYNVSLSTKSTLFQNKFLLFNLILKNIQPVAEIIKTKPNSIFLIIKNNNDTPVPNATIYITNVPSSYNFTNNSGIAEIKLFATPPKIIKIKIIFHDFETITSINLKEINSFYKPKIFVDNTKIIANNTSKVWLTIQIPPLYDDWNLLVPNNYSLLTIEKVDPTNASSLIFYQNSTNIKLKGDGKTHFINIVAIIASPIIKKISSETKTEILYGLNISISDSEIFVPVPKGSKHVTLSFINRTISYMKINETFSTMWLKVFAKNTGIYYLKIKNVINSDKIDNNSSSSLQLISGLGTIFITLVIFMFYLYKKKFKKAIIFDFDL